MKVSNIIAYGEDSLPLNNDLENTLEEFRKKIKKFDELKKKAEKPMFKVKRDDEEIEPFLFEPPEDKPKCDHEWVESMGLEKMYKDCKKCNAKWEDINEKA